MSQCFCPSEGMHQIYLFRNQLSWRFIKLKETYNLIIVLPLNYFLLSISRRERLDEHLGGGGGFFFFFFFFFKPGKSERAYLSKHKDNYSRKGAREAEQFNFVGRCVLLPFSCQIRAHPGPKWTTCEAALCEKVKAVEEKEKAASQESLGSTHYN